MITCEVKKDSSQLLYLTFYKFLSGFFLIYLVTFKVHMYLKTVDFHRKYLGINIYTYNACTHYSLN